MKPAVIKDAATTLAFHPPEGAPTAPSVVLYDEAGRQWTASVVAASVVAGACTCTVPAALVDRCAANYRAAWSYTANGSSQQRSQLFDVVRSVAYATLTAQRLTSTYYPILAGRDFPSPAFSALRQAAWERLASELDSRGRSVHGFIDSALLERAHAHFAAASVARNYHPSQTSDWGTFAAACERSALEEIERLLSSSAWYQADDDLQPDAPAGPRALRLSR